MLSDREFWAGAMLVEKQYGEDAARFIAERMLVQALEGDKAGVAMWVAIWNRFDQLRPFSNRALN